MVQRRLFSRPWVGRSSFVLEIAFKSKHAKCHSELRPAVVSRTTFSMSLMHASNLQEWLHSASWENTAPWSALCSKWQWLRAPQMLAEGSRPSALLCLPVTCCVLSLGCFSFSLHYLELFAGRELFVWTIGHIWFLTSSAEDMHRRVLHQFSYQWVAAVQLRKAVVFISANFCDSMIFQKVWITF